MTGTLTGPFTDWVLFDVSRKYGTVQSLPYSQATELIMAVEYNGQTGKGQQRELVKAHVKKLKGELEDGNFTPTPVSASLDKRHRDKLTLNPDGTFALVVDSDDPLLQTDGGHRYEALKLVVADLAEQLARATDEQERAKLARWLKQAREVPITVTVYFDGNPAKDFVNLQAGRPVDASHLKSLSIHAGMAVSESERRSHDIARALNKAAGSPFHNTVKFDSRGALPLPISTLTAKSAGDLSVSLVGLAKLGIAAEKDVPFLAKAVVDAYAALVKLNATQGDDGLLAYGKFLTPISNSGSKGSSTMLVGVGLCLAYRLVALKKAAADESDLARLAEAADAVLNKKVAGSFSGPQKRALIGRFAKEFFADLTEPRHQGVPVPLLKVLPPSAFGVAPLPKEPKPAKPKKAPKRPSVTVPPADAPVTVVEVNDPVVVGPGDPAEDFVPSWEGSDPAPPELVAAGAGPWADEIQA